MLNLASARWELVWQLLSSALAASIFFRLNTPTLTEDNLRFPPFLPLGSSDNMALQEPGGTVWKWSHLRK